MRQGRNYIVFFGGGPSLKNEQTIHPPKKYDEEYPVNQVHSPNDLEGELILRQNVDDVILINFRRQQNRHEFFWQLLEKKTPAHTKTQTMEEMI